MAFFIGQKVFCVVEGNWETLLDEWHLTHPGGPQYGDICTVTDIGRFPDDPFTYLSLAEWPDSYTEEDFEPLKSENLDARISESCDA